MFADDNGDEKLDKKLDNCGLIFGKFGHKQNEKQKMTVFNEIL